MLACASNPQPAALPVLAAPPAAAVPTLHSDLLGATRMPGVQRGTWGIVVHSLDRNERLFELNPSTLLVPASVAKLVSVATAADAVGWDYRWDTQVAAAGPVVDGTLQGDLVVYGGGDPATGGRGGDDLDALVEIVRARGIRRITGAIVAVDDALDEPRPAFAWAWDDIGYPTGALYGALNYAENRSAITVRATDAGLPATVTSEPVWPDRPLINRTATVAAGGANQLWPEQRPGEDALTIAGTIPAGAPPGRVAIAAGNPTYWYAANLRDRLRRAGIDVAGPPQDADTTGVPAETTVIGTVRSRPLGDIVQPMLKDSINLYAEAAMRLNAPKGSTADTALDAFTRRMVGWGVPRDGFQMVDGSGLSRRDVLAPDTLLAVLSRMYDATGASPWMRALPVAGVDGSLEARMKGTPAERNVRAKTGTMSNIRSLAGYVTTADGEHLAFVVMVNDFEGTGAEALQAIDAIAVRLAAFRRYSAPSASSASSGPAAGRSK